MLPSRRRTAFAACLGVAIALAALDASVAIAQAPPATDIFVARIEAGSTGPRLARPENATQRPGYDNQPAFLPDGRALLFTSVREDAQADIWRLDLATRRQEQVTRTAESEYSATPIDGGRAISVVRVEPDSTQRLWRVPLGGGASTLVLERIKPVGYHAWIDEHRLALFVLGSPNTLQLADTRTGRADTIARNIGRSLHRIPGGTRVSFVSKRAAADWWIEELDPDTRRVTPLVRLPEGTEDYVWLRDGSVLAAKDARVLRWTRGGGEQWSEVADLASAGVASITRMAVSPDGAWLAFVAVPRDAAR